MNIDLEGLDESSKVWIYQSDRLLTTDETTATQEALNRFATNWVAHSRQLKAKAILVEQRFIILAVDESIAGASGCSIDASVHFLRELQSALGVDFFDRMRFAYIKEGMIHSVDRNTFGALYADGTITGDTKVVDTLVKTKKDLAQFVKPLKDSWHVRMV